MATAGSGLAGFGVVTDAGQAGLELGRLGGGPDPRQGPDGRSRGWPAAAKIDASSCRHRRLAVGAGDPGHQQLPRRVPEEGGRHGGHRRAGRAPGHPGLEQAPGRPLGDQAFAHQPDRSRGRRPRRRARGRRFPGPARTRRGRPGAPVGCRARCRGRRRKRGLPSSRARRSRRARGSSAQVRAGGLGDDRHGRSVRRPADRAIVPPAPPGDAIPQVSAHVMSWACDAGVTPWGPLVGAPALVGMS